MEHIKINQNIDRYPIIKISTELLQFIEKEIDFRLVCNYLNIEYTELDLKIKTNYKQSFFFEEVDKIINGEIKNDELNKLKKLFPEHKIIRNGFKELIFTSEFYVDEKKYFDNSNNYGDYFIYKEKLPYKPSDYILTTTLTNDWGNSWVLLLLIIMILIFVYKLNFNSFVFLLITFIVSSIIFAPSLKKTKTNIFEVKKEKKVFDEHLANHKHKIEEIRKKITQNHNINLLQIIKKVDENRLMVEPKIICEYLKPKQTTIKKIDYFSRGKSELFFLSKLHQHFKSQVQVDSVPNIGKNPFQPDFVLICKETGFHICIEIDEPYATNMGKPIHHDRSTDKDRDDFFTRLNWGVIRFAEKQIIENTEDCIKLIQEFIFAIKNKQKVIRNEVPFINKWTYEEALIMSNSEYRNTYLPNNMKIRINYNNNNSSEINDLPF